MSKKIGMVWAILAWVLLSACQAPAEPAAPGMTEPIGVTQPGAEGQESPVEQASSLPLAPAEPVKNVSGPALPDNLELDRTEEFFSLDRTTPEVELPVIGDNSHRLFGRLRSEDGKREIVWAGREEERVLFETGWWLPGVAAVNDSGEVLVCANRPVGPSTRLTAGNMPDPRFGVDLVCRWRKGAQWAPPVTLPRGQGAVWLVNLTPRRGGRFWIIYSTDRSGLLLSDPEPGDAIWRAEFSQGRFGRPEKAYEFPLHP